MVVRVSSSSPKLDSLPPSTFAIMGAPDKSQANVNSMQFELRFDLFVESVMELEAFGINNFMLQNASTHSLVLHCSKVSCSSYSAATAMVTYTKEEAPTCQKSLSSDPIKEHLHQHEEASKYDHRILGVKQELIIHHEWSPGSWFFLPHGARIYNKLMDFIRYQYRDTCYQECLVQLDYH
ncbi:uncharacterized protein [Cicer arietinum]|uniref:uncharacterized protein n=1 Tax=Cicer arietinum TaxID=3827 RepID=UPI0006417B65